MAIEKRLPSVSSQLFTTNGTFSGVLTIADSSLFKVKQEVVITANSLPTLQLQVKRVESPNIIHVGPITGNIEARTDISSYTTDLFSAIYANEQKRPSVPEQEVERLTYEEEPVVARRAVLVDKYGNKYDNINPIPISGNIGVGLVPISYDKVDVSYPSDTITVYTFSLNSVVVGNITLTTDCSGNLISAERTL